MYRDLQPERRFIVRDLPDKEAAGVSRLVDLDDADETAVMKVMYYLDSLGQLVRRGLVSEDDIFILLAGSIVRLYSLLQPWIDAEQVARNEENFMKSFEGLATRASRSLVQVELSGENYPPFPKREDSESGHLSADLSGRERGATSDRGSLASVAGLTSELEVANGVRAALTPRNDVVELEVLLRTAIYAPSAVTSPDFMSN